MGELQIDLSRDGEIALVGRLDARTAAAARAVLQDAVDAVDGDAVRLVVDLGGLEIWDRAGLGVVIGLARRASGRGLTLDLVNAGQRELRLLRVAGVSRMARLSPRVPQQNRAGSLLGA